MMATKLTQDDLDFWREKLRTDEANFREAVKELRAASRRVMEARRFVRETALGPASLDGLLAEVRALHDWEEEREVARVRAVRLRHFRRVASLRVLWGEG